MSLLSYNRLLKLAASGVIRGVDPDYINAASIDITLGDTIRREGSHSPGTLYKTVLRERDALTTYPVLLKDDEPFYLEPGEFILAQSAQTFYLPPTISAEYKLKSSMARIGLNHCLAGWCDAGWNGSVLTLELINVSRYHTIALHKGDRIGQMIFFEHEEVPADKSYAARGRYNGDLTAQGVKK